MLINLTLNKSLYISGYCCFLDKQVVAHVDVPFLCDWRQMQTGDIQHNQLVMVPHQIKHQEPILVRIV